MICPKLDDCLKVKAVQDKELLPEQFAQMVRGVCRTCEFAERMEQWRRIGKLARIGMALGLIAIIVQLFCFDRSVYRNNSITKRNEAAKVQKNI